MSFDNFDNIFKVVVGEEGGYVNDPKDRGGPTKFGVTQATLAAWRRRPVTAADVQKLGIDEAKQIFRAQYWSKIQGDRLPAGVDLAIADTAFNSGPGRAARILQTAAGVSVDGIVGEKTLATVASKDLPDLIDAIARERLAFLKTTYGWGRFGKGWTNRVRRVTATAVAMSHPMLTEPVSLVQIPPMEGTRADHNQAVTRTPAGKAKIVASIGAIGTAATDAADKIHPLIDMMPTLKWMFVGMTIIGIGVGFWVQVKTLQKEASQ